MFWRGFLDKDFDNWTSYTVSYVDRVFSARFSLNQRYQSEENGRKYEFLVSLKLLV